MESNGKMSSLVSIKSIYSLLMVQDSKMSQWKLEKRDREREREDSLRKSRKNANPSMFLEFPEYSPFWSYVTRGALFNNLSLINDALLLLFELRKDCAYRSRKTIILPHRYVYYIYILLPIDVVLEQCSKEELLNTQ